MCQAAGTAIHMTAAAKQGSSARAKHAGGMRWQHKSGARLLFERLALGLQQLLHLGAHRRGYPPCVEVDDVFFHAALAEEGLHRRPARVLHAHEQQHALQHVSRGGGRWWAVLVGLLPLVTGCSVPPPPAG